MRHLRSTGRTIPFLVLSIGLGLTILSAATSGSGALAQSPALHIPDVQVRGGATGNARTFSPGAVDSQEGFGDSALEIQDLGGEGGAVTIAIAEKRSGEPVTELERTVEAGASTVIDLSRVGGIGFGDFSASLRGDLRFGAIARTRWANGATTVYRAPEAGDDLILPLLVANVLGHATIFSVQNTSAVNASSVEVLIFDNEDGGALQTLTETIEGSQTVSWDTFLDRPSFAPPALPANAHGGYIGSARIRSNGVVAAMAYGDENEGKGSSAYAARPVSAASALQYLPLVRSGSGGDSLIGIANADNRAVDVVIEYRAAAVDSAGAAVASTQSFTIARRGTAVIDLSERRRGNQPAPDLGRFAGSATIRASGPVLAASIEDRRAGETVDAVAAYNAFGPADLGTTLAIPRVRRGADFATTAFAVFNPGPGAARARVDLFAADGRPAGTAELDVAAGGVAWLSVGSIPGFAVGTGRAIVTASRPVAVLAYEERDTSVKPEPQPVRITLVEIMDSGTTGSARLMQVGGAVEVEVRVDGGGSANATINEGTCSLTPGRELHALSDVAGGLSLTRLSPLQLADLATGAHAIRVHTVGFRGMRRQLACGIIPYVAGAEDADLSVVEALVIDSLDEAPTETPTVPPTDPPTAPPRATPTATSVEPTPTPAPTRTSDGAWTRVYLPLARRDG